MFSQQSSCLTFLTPLSGDPHVPLLLLLLLLLFRCCSGCSFLCPTVRVKGASIHIVVTDSKCCSEPLILLLIGLSQLMSFCDAGEERTQLVGRGEFRLREVWSTDRAEKQQVWERDGMSTRQSHDPLRHLTYVGFCCCSPSLTIATSFSRSIIRKVATFSWISPSPYLVCKHQETNSGSLSGT